MIEPAFAHILIVEDRDDNYFILQDLLIHELGVAGCLRCLEARQLIEQLDDPATGIVDLVLFDIKRPLRAAFELVPALRAHPKLVTARIVALTANIMPEDVERTRQAGFDGFIGIPIDQARFPGQIRRLLHDESVWEPRAYT